MFNLFKISDFENNFNSKYIFLSEIPVENQNNLKIISNTNHINKERINHKNIANEHLDLEEKIESQIASAINNFDEPKIEIQIDGQEIINGSIIVDNNTQNNINVNKKSNFFILNHKDN